MSSSDRPVHRDSGYANSSVTRRITPPIDRMLLVELGEYIEKLQDRILSF